MKKSTIQKASALCCALVLCLSLFAGCAGDSTGAGGHAFDEEVITPGKLVIGTSADYPPYESLSLDGEVEGFDIDMMREVAKYMSEGGSEIEVEFKNMDFDTIVTALQVGQIDLGVSAFTYRPDREVLFSTPYLVSEQLVSVTAESGITSIEELEGKNIGAGNGTTGEAAAKEQIKDANVTNPGNYNIMFEALKNGALDAVVCDGLVAKNFSEANGFVVLEPALESEENSVIVKIGNEELNSAVNAAIEKFVASDAYEELQKKWGIIAEE